MAQLTHAPALLRPPTDRKPPKNLLALCLGIAIFAAMSLWAAVASKGFLEMDACTHYMFARHGLSEPEYLINIWGRPLCTCMYVLPAAIGGVLGVRVTSLILAIATGLIAYRIAQKQNYRLPAMAAVLLFAQPLFYLHSFSELTEIPFAFVAILAFWAYQSRRFVVMAILVSITPSGRPEGIFLVGLAGLALLAHRRWYYLFILPIPVLIWSYLGWRSFGSQPSHHWYLWLKENWPYAMESAYGSGPWYSFIIQLPVLLSPLIFPAFFPGVYLSIRQGLKRLHKARTEQGPHSRLPAFFTDHTARCQFIIAFIPLFILVVHSILWTFGMMGSNGELRYLLCVAPLWALLCAKGWEAIWQRFHLRAPFLVAALASTSPIFANVYYKVVPLRLYESDLLGQEVANWYQKTPGLAADYPRVMASLPSAYYALDVSQTDTRHGETWGRENVLKKADGVLLIWDKNALTNASRTMIVEQKEVDAAGWIWIGNIVYGGEWCNAYLSPRTITGKPTDPDKYHTPIQYLYDR
jgi:hypothetical protein